MTDLESYKAYWFFVSAIGAAGEGLPKEVAQVLGAKKAKAVIRGLAHTN